MRKSLLRKFIAVSAIAITVFVQIKPVHAVETIGTHAETCPPHRVLVASSEYTGKSSIFVEMHSITYAGATTHCIISDVYDNYRVIYSCNKCKTYTYVENESRYVGRFHGAIHY